jgi:hypothetical protein
MAAAIAVTGSGEHLTPLTVSISGCGATTAYQMMVTRGDGAVQTVRFTTDGSGAASVQVVKGVNGKWSFALRPTTECKCTTAAAASATFGG